MANHDIPPPPPPPHHPHEGEMRSVAEVREMILSAVQPLAPIELPLKEAQGCVAAQEVTAPGDLPPFASSAMDGYAVRATDVLPATPADPVRLKVVGVSAAGHPSDATVGGSEAIQIATGATIPAGADCVVPIEDCAVEAEHVAVLRDFPEGAHVRPAGEDFRAGDPLVPAGRRLGPPELGLLAAAGHPTALVYPRPRVVVLSTGDELVEPGRDAGYGHIHDANSFTLYSALKEAGAAPYLGGIVPDDADALRDAVLGLSARADCFISSGGVSVGERDVVKKALFRRGEVDFYRVAMQPGMPQGFGAVEGRPFFGLPGNPVSVFVSFEIFIRPAILKMMGRKDLFRPEIWAIADEDIRGRGEKVVFARVRVRREETSWRCSVTGPSGSNLLGTVAGANGLAIIPVGTEVIGRGQSVRVILLRPLEG